MNLDHGDELPAQLVKALFGKLVKAVGGQVAASVILEVTQQYVCQMCSLRENDAKTLPSLRHIWTLEKTLGRSVVLEGLVSAINPTQAHEKACLLEETAEVTQAAADLMGAAVRFANGSGGMDGVTQAVDRLKQEVGEAAAVVRAKSPAEQQRAA